MMMTSQELCEITCALQIAHQSNSIHATFHCRNTRAPIPQIQPAATSTLNGAQMQKSFKAHEAQYQAAWERTFGDDLIEKGWDGREAKA